MERGKLPVTNYFYPRPPRGGRRSACRRKLRCCPISIHALREEGDVDVVRCAEFHGQFLSTPSARRATILSRGGGCTVAYFYPRPPRGGRRRAGRVLLLHLPISIHALREEGDKVSKNLTAEVYTFLSTPSARRATKSHRKCSPLLAHFYPRPPRGGRRILWKNWKRFMGHFYPRPPRGGRQYHDSSGTNLEHFYPRPPRGGRPLLCQ